MRAVVSIYAGNGTDLHFVALSRDSSLVRTVARAVLEDIAPPEPGDMLAQARAALLHRLACERPGSTRS